MQYARLRELGVRKWAETQPWLRDLYEASKERPNRGLLEESLRFQGDLVHLLEEPLPRRLRSTIYCAGGMVFLALFVAIVFKVDVVVQGMGKLTYDGQPIVLQPYERAVLRTLLVKPGDTVRKGQVLATLDPTFTQADLTALESRQRAVRAHLRRLEAEAEGRAYEVDPADGPAGTLQLQIFTQRAVEYQSRAKVLESTVESTRAELRRVEAAEKSLSEQLALVVTVEEMKESLFKIKTNSKLEYLDAKSSRLRAEREHREAKDRVVELRYRLETAEAQREAFVQEWRRGLLEEIQRQRSEQFVIESSLTKTNRINNLVVISAPEDGVVLDIANRSVGSVLRDAEPLVILVPSTVPLVGEIQLSSAEVGDAAVGDTVLVKVDAFPYHRYGGLHGKIRSISYDSHPSGMPDGDLESLASRKSPLGGAVHRVVIELQGDRLERLPANRKLFPGMTVSGEVFVGKRRVITYLLNPLIRGLRESFREP